MKPEDFRQMLSRAIDAAIEAHTFYCMIADKAADTALKNIFGELAGDELNHRDFLQEIMLKGSRALHLEESYDYKTAVTPELLPLSEDIAPIEGILFAIRKELDAMQLFTQLSKIVRDPGDKSAFLELAKREKDHKARLEDIYTNMALPKAW
jgi:rubrerythrin